MPQQSALWLSLILTIVFAMSCEAVEAARPFIHPLFTDHMVFPRDRAAPVWGWTTPNAQVQATLATAHASTVADADGRWQLALGPLQAGGPYELVVEGPQRKVCSNIMVGDVWLFCGQSNMEYGVASAEGAGDELARAGSEKNLRLLNLGHRFSGRPCVVPAGAAASWQVPNAGSVAGFSAVAWYTARRLAAELTVPIGAVACAWSGSNICGWMSEQTLNRLGAYSDERAALKTLTNAAERDGRTVAAQELLLRDDWWKANDPGTAEGWQQVASHAAWNAVDMPQKWTDAGVVSNGAIWLRPTIEVPAGVHSAHLAVGRLAEDQAQWVNGSEIPFTGVVPDGVLKAGRNVVAIRIWSPDGRGAAGSVDEWRLECAGMQPISLAGTWQVVCSAAVSAVSTRPALHFQGGPESVSMLFNGGIAALAPFAFTGVVYYQGEQDAGNPDYYRLLPALIADWRTTFAAPDLPFVIVQLPAFRAPISEPVQATVQFGMARDAQLETARSVPHVGLAVTVDLGDADNVHPRRKREVGERAAHAALETAYGRDDGGGPLYAGMTVTGDAIRVTFTHATGGLVMHEGVATGFAVTGGDSIWHHASAILDGLAVVVRSTAVPHPTAVRYGWAENPPVTLFDRAGMPASPFRTDPR